MKALGCNKDRRGSTGDPSELERSLHLQLGAVNLEELILDGGALRVVDIPSHIQVDECALSGRRH